jgi:SAM-dependent methyltransferase
MNTELYTPAYSPGSTQFMERRSASSHASFFTPYLQPSMHVLDCGCGPGTITSSLAEYVPQGMLVGIDRESSQIVRARERTAENHNVRFEVSGVYELPFADDTFDAVFSHALFEHLHDPGRALAEIRRVLKPAGIIGLRSPDWGGFLVAPESVKVSNALLLYEEMQRENGGDTRIGRRLGTLLRDAGFDLVNAGASYEVYDDPVRIADYLAEHLDRPGSTNTARQAAASAWREWGRDPNAFFAQAWGEAVGVL